MELEADVDMSELANLPPVSVSVEVKLPDEIDEEEVVTLFQVLQEDVEGFDEMLLQAVQSIDNSIRQNHKQTKITKFLLGNMHQNQFLLNSLNQTYM
jgi:hypothetical protein